MQIENTAHGIGRQNVPWNELPTEIEILSVEPLTRQTHKYINREPNQSRSRAGLAQHHRNFCRFITGFITGLITERHIHLESSDQARSPVRAHTSNQYVLRLDASLIQIHHQGAL